MQKLPGLRSRAILLGTLLVCALPSVAQQRDANGAKSALLFFQSGVAPDNTRSYTVGATWKWNWRRQYSLATATAYTEFSVGRWATSNDRGGSSDWVTQIGITPVLRLQPRSQFADWFLELGVGANMILPTYWR
jgi:squalene cyclase